jgi:heat shock protein HslJ
VPNAEQHHQQATTSSSDDSYVISPPTTILTTTSAFSFRGIVSSGAGCNASSGNTPSRVQGENGLLAA